jgi:hypothetical protein
MSAMWLDLEDKRGFTVITFTSRAEFFMQFLFSRQRAGVNTGCRVAETNQRAQIRDNSLLMSQSHLARSSGTTPV